MARIHIGITIQPDAQRLRIMLNALVELNLLEMSRNLYPPLYESGVRYQREPMSLGRPERWQTVSETYKRRFGDCEDLACIRVAELRKQGIRAIPWLIKHDNLWHVIVKYPDGHTEDPSRRLGMNAKPPPNVKVIRRHVKRHR